MVGGNERAEELMRALELAEEERTDASADGASDVQQSLHLCIVNLAIGTLYCAKGNFSFGISRITKSLEPLEQRLGTDTWFYAKRTLLALAEDLAKSMVCVPDSTIDDVLAFLDGVERHGSNIHVVPAAAAQTTHTVTASTPGGGSWSGATERGG